MSASIRIFSYLPNPRVFKSLIAARLCHVNVEVIGDKPANLSSWLWDYDAHLLADDQRNDQHPAARQSSRGFSGRLFKTDEFLQAQPFGTVPAAFAADGQIGIFESNSILRAVARIGKANTDLYGGDDLAMSRVDSFLDANLVFAREAQVYLLALKNMSPDIHARMQEAFDFYLRGIEQALTSSRHLASDELTIADISFVCDVIQLLRERLMAEKIKQSGFGLISNDAESIYPLAFNHLRTLSLEPVFAEILGDSASSVLL